MNHKKIRRFKETVASFGWENLYFISIEDEFGIRYVNKNDVNKDRSNEISVAKPILGHVFETLEEMLVAVNNGRFIELIEPHNNNYLYDIDDLLSYYD